MLTGDPYCSEGGYRSQKACSRAGNLSSRFRREFFAIRGAACPEETCGDGVQTRRVVSCPKEPLEPNSLL